MEDDGITSEKGSLGRKSIDAISTLVGLKYLRIAILESTHDSATGFFRGYVFLRKNKISKNLEKFVPQKFLTRWI